MKYQLKYYNSLKFCPIFSFFESTEDERYLLILDNYIELPEIDENFKLKLTEIKKILKKQYQENEPEQDNKLFDLSKELSRIQADQQFILSSLNILLYKNSGIQANYTWIENKLNEMDYKINPDRNLNEEINRLKNKAISKNNRIKKILKEINDLIEIEKNDQNKSNYLELILMIESIANIKLDIYKDSMLKFIFAKNKMIEIIEQRKKLINKNVA